MSQHIETLIHELFRLRAYCPPLTESMSLQTREHLQLKAQEQTTSHSLAFVLLELLGHLETVARSLNYPLPPWSPQRPLYSPRHGVCPEFTYQQLLSIVNVRSHEHPLHVLASLARVVAPSWTTNPAQSMPIFADSFVGAHNPPAAPAYGGMRGQEYGFGVAAPVPHFVTYTRDVAQPRTANSAQIVSRLSSTYFSAPNPPVAPAYAGMPGQGLGFGAVAPVLPATANPAQRAPTLANPPIGAPNPPAAATYGGMPSQEYGSSAVAQVPPYRYVSSLSSYCVTQAPKGNSGLASLPQPASTAPAGSSLSIVKGQPSRVKLERPSKEDPQKWLETMCPLQSCRKDNCYEHCESCGGYTFPAIWSLCPDEWKADEETCHTWKLRVMALVVGWHLHLERTQWIREEVTDVDIGKAAWRKLCCRVHGDMVDADSLRNLRETAWKKAISHMKRDHEEGLKKATRVLAIPECGLCFNSIWQRSSAGNFEDRVPGVPTWYGKTFLGAFPPEVQLDSLVRSIISLEASRRLTRLICPPWESLER